MAVQTRIYAGGAFAFGQQNAVTDISNSGYNALIMWSVHVSSTGTLALNNTQIVTNGKYA
ncbi:MAG: hypothetical protein JNM88_14010, partial [Chitinophagaceae bacterium]|nr:hypothetical protein [Chitinophagaceae bacterium]